MNAIDIAGVLRELPSLGAALEAASRDVEPAYDLLSSFERFFSVSEVKYKEDGRYPCIACAADFCQKYGRTPPSEDSHQHYERRVDEFDGRCKGRGGLCDVSLSQNDIYYQCLHCSDVALCPQCFNCGDHFPHTLRKVQKEVTESPPPPPPPPPPLSPLTPATAVTIPSSEVPPTVISSTEAVPTPKTRTLCWEPVRSFFKKVLRKKRTPADGTASEQLSIAGSESMYSTYHFV